MVYAFIFHRDFRIDDNLALIECCKDAKKNGHKVCPIFIFDCRQCDPKENEYYNDISFRFLVSCVKAIKEKIPLLSVYGFDIIDRFDKIYCSRDFTPFAIKRDENYVKIDNLLINPPERVCKNDGDGYRVFTPWLKKAKKIEVRDVEKFEHYDVLEKCDFVDEYLPDRDIDENPFLLLDRQKERLKSFKDYDEKRDCLTYKTTQIGVFIKYGLMSPIEFLNMAPTEKLKEQMYWRDFYYHLGHYYHEEFYIKKNMLDKEWGKQPPKNLMKTDYKLIDSTLRQLVDEHWVHNRGRMLLASYLAHTKNFDWRPYEKLYAQNLIDYDYTVNLGNWMYSTGFMAGMFTYRYLKPDSEKHNANEYIDLYYQKDGKHIL